MPTTANNETLERIKDEVARERLGKDWNVAKCIVTSMVLMDWMDIVCERFARAVALASLKEAAENAVQWDIKVNGQQRIDPSAITDEKNIKLL